MPVTVDDGGSVQLMADMGERSVDLSPVLAVIASDLLTFTDDSFQKQASPGGKTWDELDPATLKQRRERKKNPNASTTILVDTSILRNSITAVAGVSAILLGTNVVYAGVQQFGSKDGNTPARPYMPFQLDGDSFAPITEGLAEDEWERYERMIAHYIETGEILVD